MNKCRACPAPIRWAHHKVTNKGNPLDPHPAEDGNLLYDEHTGLYDLRHSFVTLSLIAGVGAETVSEQAGHATVALTLDTYAHVLPVMQETACDKLEGLLGKK